MLEELKHQVMNLFDLHIVSHQLLLAQHRLYLSRFKNQIFIIGVFLQPYEVTVHLVQNIDGNHVASANATGSPNFEVSTLFANA